ncbi:MAG: RDD family protein [Ruminococcus sp.]|nr:RDD family protein [Ruminococcus sp.]
MTSYNTGNVKLRRVLAFMLDMFFSFVLVFTVLIIVTVILGANNKIDLVTGKLTGQILNKFSVLLLFRDFLCGGTSLSKRIFGLRVIDYTTHKKPPVLKRILRALFFLILPVDAITMLIEGRSIGDRVANTIVVPKNSINSLNHLTLTTNTLNDIETDNTTFNTPDTDNESKEMKRIIITGVVFVLAIISFLSLICFGWYSAL